jgi:cytochrome b561
MAEGVKSGIGTNDSGGCRRGVVVVVFFLIVHWDYLLFFFLLLFFVLNIPSATRGRCYFFRRRIHSAGLCVVCAVACGRMCWGYFYCRICIVLILSSTSRVR